MAGDEGTRAGRPVVRSAAEAERLVLDVLRMHADSLLRVARRHSLCLDDAQDAYQRAVEIFLRHAATLEADGAHKWLHTVLKHEAMRIRGGRTRMVSSEDVDFDTHEARDLPDADEQLVRFERTTRSAEALQRLKPQELRALWLKAQGHSYEEIANICSWSYTKVNRCITEGRRSFLDRYADIGSGAECRRWEPVLSAMVDGEAAAKDLTAVRPHLRNCPACRARVRALRESSLGLAALLPPSALASGGLFARLHDVIAERILLSATKLQAGLEAALPGKLAVVAASAAAIAGGGVAVERVVSPPSRPSAARAVAWPRAVKRPVLARPLHATPAVAAPGRPNSAQRPAAKTTKAEFGLSRQRASTASHGTAAREFQPDPTTSATATSASASPRTVTPIHAPAGASKATREAAAEFGGG